MACYHQFSSPGLTPPLRTDSEYSIFLSSLYYLIRSFILFIYLLPKENGNDAVSTMNFKITRIIHIKLSNTCACRFEQRFCVVSEKGTLSRKTRVSFVNSFSICVIFFLKK